MKYKYLRLLFLFQIYFISSSFAGDQEDYIWWAQAHNWDYVTPWRQYLKTSAAFFGPTALPIPTMNKASISNKFSLELKPELHWSKGDKTADIYTSLKLPLASRVDFEVFMVPIEYFSLDSATRHNRAVRHIDAKGFEGGDIWFGTNFQLLKKKGRMPDVLASVYFKTASGTGLEYARFTDAPGYFILLSAGNDIWFNKDKSKKWRIYGQAGFFAYQTWDYLHNQNDCIVYGIGSEYSSPQFKFSLDLSGYYGYLGNGDRPTIIKSVLSSNFDSFNFAINLQYGIHDFNYFTSGFSVIYNFGKTLDP